MKRKDIYINEKEKGSCKLISRNKNKVYIYTIQNIYKIAEKLKNLISLGVKNYIYIYKFITFHT